jgi:hypothetical protein
MFRLTGLIIGVLTGLFLTRNILLDFLLRGGMSADGDFTRGGIAISCIAGLVCGLGGYIIGGIIDSVRKKKPKDS